MTDLSGGPDKSRFGRRLDGASMTLRTLARSRSDPSAKPVHQQIREMLALRRSRTGLSPSEYHMLKLQDRTFYRDVDLTEICGSRMRKWLHRELNNPNWDAVVSDKVNMAIMFAHAGIPHPELYGIYSKFERTCGSTPVVRDAASLITFLSCDTPYPLFCKPVKGGSAASCHRLDAVDPLTGQLTLPHRKSLAVEQFVEQLRDPTGWGFIFQEAMTPALDTIAVAGHGVTGLRMCLLLGDDGPRPFRATWKIPAGGSITDNFGDGDRGNMMASVDPHTGIVQRVVRGMWENMAIDEPHPDTGAVIVGTKVPGWDDVVEVSLAASRAFPGFRFQHWDVGLTSRGPVMYELNTAGQLFDVAVKGSYDDELRIFIDTYGGGTQHSRDRGPVVGVEQQRNKADREDTMARSRP